MGFWRAQAPATPPRGGRERCDRGLWGGGVAATPLLHTQNCGMSHDRGVATPWSATGRGVASAPLSFGIVPEMGGGHVSFYRG